MQFVDETSCMQEQLIRSWFQWPTAVIYTEMVILLFISPSSSPFQKNIIPLTLWSRNIKGVHVARYSLISVVPHTRRHSKLSLACSQATSTIANRREDAPPRPASWFPNYCNCCVACPPNVPTRLHCPPWALTTRLCRPTIIVIKLTPGVVLVFPDFTSAWALHLHRQYHHHHCAVCSS